MPTANSSLIRFGSFELDLATGELSDMQAPENRVLLREQVFQVLRLLLERDGKIVTRDEIKGRLWPNDTVVDFDRSINATIKTLRRALRDTPDSPRYVETLARRGYRLMVPIEYLRPEPKIGHGEVSCRAVYPEPRGSHIGKKLLHYRVLDVIGAGGMGVVYRAEDLKLGRGVALKFLPDELTGDAVAMQRFEREARAASSLNHPNICTIHAIEEREGQPFIVMELLEGETLRNRMVALEPKPLPFNELLDIAAQVCSGLEAAHHKGIIHPRHQTSEHRSLQIGSCEDPGLWIGKACQRHKSRRRSRRNHHRHLTRRRVQSSPYACRHNHGNCGLHVSRTGPA